ncbi:hypothetical protein [Streptomyces sp. NPDC097619]|uniref:hypothetical protein n=1 Tax=Streptomyces sp. NPDC097619 TaxID=3157228 RepID=UPI00331D0958
MKKLRPRGSRARQSLATFLALAFPVAALVAVAPTEDARANTVPDVNAGESLEASEIEAFALAAETGKRVEILDRRTEYAETFANPDGSLNRKQYVQPVWTRYDQTWRKTDPTVVRRADGSLGPKAATYGVSFSTGGTVPMATLEKYGKRLTLSWPDALPEPVVEGNTALYKSVLPGVDLKLIAKVDGFAEHLIVNTPEAAANPAIKSIKLGVATDGVTLDDTAADELIAKDANGEVVFRSPKPTMWEHPNAGESASSSPAPSAQKSTTSKLRTSGAAASGTTSAARPESAPVAADVVGGTLTLTPDPKLLASADQFPLIIDPDFAGGEREKWAVVYSATPTADYPNGSGWNSSNPADEPRVGFNGTGDTQAFFAMNTDGPNGIHGATILDATFAVEQTYSWGCDAGLAGPTELWTSKDISTTPTWATRNNYWGSTKLASKSFASGHPNCSGTKGVDFKSAALTKYVQDAANGGWDPLVFGLRVPDSHLGNVNSFKRFKNTPALEVTYNYKPEVLDSDAYEGNYVPGGDGNKPVPCTTGVIGNNTLVLTARVRDRDSGNVQANFTVTNAAGTVIARDSDEVFKDGTAIVKIDLPDTATGTHKWSVTAKDIGTDEGASSPATTPCSFSVDRQGPSGAPAITFPDGLYTHQARTEFPVKAAHTATDLAGFCWIVDREFSVSSTRCSNGTWVSVPRGAKTATFDITATGVNSSYLRVQAWDLAGNPSPPSRTTMSLAPAEVVYNPGENPLTPVAPHDRRGDLNGDGHPDVLATDNTGKLHFYAGGGTGALAAGRMVGTAGWKDALIAHGGDFTGFAARGAVADRYEDMLVRLADDKLYKYPGNGLGDPWTWSREEITAPSSTLPGGWKNLRQMILPGDVDKRTDSGYARGDDLITIECSALDSQGNCTNAKLWLYPGRTEGTGAGIHASQVRPFDTGARKEIGSGGWKDFDLLAVGDQTGPEAGENAPDGVIDFLARDGSGKLYLYPGVIDGPGHYRHGSPKVYGNPGWNPGNRPLVTSAGNAQGKVEPVPYQEDNTTQSALQFLPTSGEQLGDLWATTPADPDLTVSYIDGDGNPATRTCPSGCLLFYPGAATTHRQPRLVGTGAWSSVITGIF